MTEIQKTQHQKTLHIYFAIIAISALGLAMGGDLLSNYFKDAYNATTYQRGFIELPRELPGMICLFVIALLSFLSDIRISMIAQFLSMIGIAILGFWTPIFSVMLIFIFVNSLGMHMFMPLQDSIGLSLIKGDQVGKRMGQFKGLSTAFAMLGGIIAFLGFRLGFFSFTQSIKWNFVIAAFLFGVVLVLFFVLEKHVKEPIRSDKKVRFVFRKKYKYYYTLVVMFGVQKQIMIVYGPWVLIELLGKKADTLAVLGIIGSFVGIFFMPAVGKWLDRFGIKAMLYVDALSFIGVYLVYGILSAGFSSGSLALVGVPVLLTYLLYIVDRMSNQLGMVRTLYLKSILVEPTDLTPTLSMGLSMDHVVSIICAYLGGIVWGVWGPQYIFFLAAALSCVNLLVAYRVNPKLKNA